MSSKTFRGADSKINEHMWDFVRYVAKVKPVIAVFESVQPAYRRADGKRLMQELRTELERLSGVKYNLWHILHNVYSIGGPAQRRRYFWLVSRVPFGIELPILKHTPTLHDIISDLEPLGLTWNKQPYRSPVSLYARQFRSTSGAVDGMITLMNPMINRIYDLLESIPWNPGEHIAQVVRRHYELFGTLPKSFSSDMQSKIIRNNFNMGFTTPIRWDESKHARVITGASLYCVVHPYLNRMITHREAARIVGFPDDWKIAPLRNVSKVHATWGKGITVHAGKWIGTWIKNALDGSPGFVTGDAVGYRERVLDISNTWKNFCL